MSHSSRLTNHMLCRTVAQMANHSREVHGLPHRKRFRCDPTWHNSRGSKFDTSKQYRLNFVQLRTCNDGRQAVLVYDVANRGSFEELEQWLAEAADFGAGGIPMAVCANKVCDERKIVLSTVE